MTVSHSPPPIFGRIESSIKYTDRPGAYGFLRDEHDRLAIVQTTFGFFLPGGGQEPGESLDTTLRREIQEELGYEILNAKSFAQAIQYHWSNYYKQGFKKIGTFYKVEAAPINPHPGYQNEHNLVWWTIPLAQKNLSQEFQRWSVGEYLAQFP